MRPEFLLCFFDMEASVKGATAVLALCAALLPAVALAGSKTLSNTELEDFSVSILPGAEAAADQSEPPAAPSPTFSEEAAFPGTATAKSSAEQAAAPRSPTPRKKVETATAARGPATDAGSPKLVLHLKAAIDVVIRSKNRSAREGVRFDPQTGIVELRIGENVISIDAPGTQGISFER